MGGSEGDSKGMTQEVIEATDKLDFRADKVVRRG
jgi:hypothetical protein